MRELLVGMQLLSFSTVPENNAFSTHHLPLRLRHPKFAASPKCTDFLFHSKFSFRYFFNG